VDKEAHLPAPLARKVDRLVEALGLAGVSKDTVWRRCAGLDEQVTAFGERSLDSRYP
jgi:putative transposase